MSFQTISVTASATEVDQFTMTFLAKTGSNYNDHLQVSSQYYPVLFSAFGRFRRKIFLRMNGEQKYMRKYRKIPA